MQENQLLLHTSPAAQEAFNGYYYDHTISVLSRESSSELIRSLVLRLEKIDNIDLTSEKYVSTSQ